MKGHSKLIFLVFFIFLTSCVPAYKAQLFSVEAVNLKDNEKGWVFENEKIKIKYDFWAQNGIMSFEVFNKLDSPIYIDWKNSALVYNGNKNDYWIDEVNSLSNTSSVAVNSLFLNNSVIQNGKSQSLTKSVRTERITFIPPNTNIRYSKFKLINDEFIDFKLTNDNIFKEKSKVNSRKMATKYLLPFDNTNTILTFRNYLTFSMTENSKDYFFINNEFYLSNIKEMNSSEFDSKLDYSKKSFYIDKIKFIHGLKAKSGIINQADPLYK
jgi:hypothetical protein